MFFVRLGLALGTLPIFPLWLAAVIFMWIVFLLVLGWEWLLTGKVWDIEHTFQKTVDGVLLGFWSKYWSLGT